MDIYMYMPVYTFPWIITLFSDQPRSQVLEPVCLQDVSAKMDLIGSTTSPLKSWSQSGSRTSPLNSLNPSGSRTSPLKS